MEKIILISENICFDAIRNGCKSNRVQQALTEAGQFWWLRSIKHVKLE